MASMPIIDQLDAAIDVIVADRSSVLKVPHVRPGVGRTWVAPADENLRGLLEIARELSHLPDPAFKARLKQDLQEQAFVLGGVTTRERSARVVATAPAAPESATDLAIMPTLFGKGTGSYPIHSLNFVTSFVLHAAAVALAISSGLWISQHSDQLPQKVVSVFTGPSPYVLPPAPTHAGGGGGGGDRDKINASKGAPPPFTREQLAPPAIVVRNAQPKLSAEPTVVGPPALSFPPSWQMGDPLATLLTPPSNGIGSGSGIGSGHDGGVGSGSGPGVGPGMGGGFGGGIYHVGGGVSAPRAIFAPDPEYSDEARKAKYQGTVILWVIIDAEGRPREIKVARSLGMGLDKKALQAVRNWRFEPALKDNQPVAVQVNIEINFRLY
jgi:periplasmic protein TonB